MKRHPRRLVRRERAGIIGRRFWTFRDDTTPAIEIEYRQPD